MSNFIEERKKSRHKNNTYSQPLKVSEIFEKRKAEKSLGLDTLSTDLSTLNTTIQGIYGGWQTPETMAKLRPDVENMYNRLLAYQEYENKYAPKPNVDFRTTFDDLGVPLSQRASYKNPADYVEKTRKMKTAALVEAYNPEKWDTLTETYGGFKNADAYNNMMKTAKFDEKFGGLSFDAVQKEKAKYSPDSDEYKYLDTYTAYSNLGDFEKAIGVEKPKQDALDTIAKYESDIEGYRNGVNNSTGRARQEYQKKLSDTESALSKYLADQGYASVDEAKKSVASNYDSLSRARNKYKTEHGTYDLYGDVVNGKDFAENSKYVSTKGNYSSGWEKFTEGQYGMGYGDLTYEYINNVNGIREDIERSASAYGMNSGSGISSMQKKSYDKLNPEEVALYNALYKEDKENGTNKAQQFLEEMEVTLSKRTYDEDTKRWKDASDSVVGGILTSALSVPANIMGGFTGGIEAIKDKVSGKEYNPYSYYKTPTNFASDTRQYVGENIAEATEGFELFGQNIPSFLYQTAMSMADSTVGAYTMGTAFTPIMGSTAFQQKAKEMHEAGESEDVIFSTALMSGVAEALFEYVSIDKLLKIKDIDSFRGIVKAGLKQAGIEASEEVFTEIANIMSDTIIRGDNSEYMQMYTDLIKRGYSDKEASTEVAKKIGGNIAWAGIGGFLSGGGMGTFHSVGNYNENKSTGSTIRGNERVGEMLDVVQNMTPQEADAYKTYEKYAKKGVTADNITDAQLGNLYNSANAETQESLSSKKSTLEQRGQANEIQKRLSDINEEKALPKETIEAIDTRIGVTKEYRNAVPDLISEGLESGEDTQSFKLASEYKERIENGETLTDAEIQNLVQANAKAIQSETISNYTSLLSPEEADLFRSLYDGKTDIDAYASSFNLVANYSKGNFTEDYILQNKGVLSTKQVQTIYNEMVLAPRNAVDRALDTFVSKMGKKVGYKCVIDDSIIDYDSKTTDGSKVNWNELDDRQRDAINFIKKFSEAMGINLKLKQSEVTVYGERKGENGSYDPDKNTITIDVYAGIKGLASSELSRDTIITTFSHEMTHWMKAKAPTLYKELSNQVFGVLTRSGISEKDLIDNEIDRIKSRHSDMEDVSDDYARDEIIARACEDMLSMSEEGRKIFDSLSASEKKTFVEKIKAMVKELIEWIDNLLSEYKSDRAEAKFLRKYKEDLSAISKTWDSMLVRSRKTNQALQNEGVVGERLGKAVNSVMDTIDQFSIEKLTELAKAQDENGNPLFQYRAIVEDEDTYRQMLLAHKDTIGITEKDINDLFKLVDEAVDIVAENVEILDYAWDTDIDDRAFMPVKPNSDSLYRVSLDFSTLCRKRLLQQSIQTLLQDTLNKQLSREESIAIRDELIKIQEEGRQIEVACALCYVESARMKSPVQINKFLNNREKVIREFFAGRSGGDIKEKIKVAEKKAREKLKRDNPNGMKGKNDKDIDILTSPLNAMLSADAKYIRDAKREAKLSYKLTEHEQAELKSALEMSVSDFTSAEGLENLAKNHKDLFDAYTSYIRNATHSKGIEKDTWWRVGDSELIGDNLIKQMNEENGLRSQSWSDFQVIHLLDYIAATIELSTKGAKRQSYTKVPDYVKLLGNTGDMINMSLIPTRAFSGKLEYDPVEGMAYEIAKELRKKYHSTVGTICIGMANEQIKMLLADSTIDMVIPYHKSSMAKTVRKLMHIPSWMDYELYQQEKKLSDSEAKANAKKYGVSLVKDKNYQKAPKFSEWFDLAEARQIAEMENANPTDATACKKYGVMYGGYMAMQNAANNYLKLCAERGLSPKFSHPDADFTGEANYWKLLIDRKMVDNVTGEVIEQKAIKPIFNRKDVLGILNDELARYPSVKADQEYATRKVFEKFMSGDMKVDESTTNAIKVTTDNIAKVNILESGALLKKQNSDRQQSIPTDEIYDIMGENDKLKKRVDVLTADIERWKERLKMEGKVTNGQYFRTSTLENLAGHLRKKYNSSIDKARLTDMLREITQIIHNLDTSGITSDQLLNEHLFPIAYAIAEQMSVKPSIDQEANDIIKAIRGEKIIVSEDMIGELRSIYDKRWNAAFFGKFNVAKGETSNVDEVYARLREEYPSVFPEVTSDGDMLPTILDVYNRMKDAMYVEEQFNVHEVAMDIAREIYTQVWNLAPTKTVADRYTEKIKALKVEHNKAMSELKQTYGDRVERQRLADDMYYGKKMHEMSKGKEEAVAKQRLADDMYYSRIINNIRKRDEMALDLAKKKGKEKLDKYKENALRKTILQRITANVLGLSRKLIKNSKDEHVPEIMKPIIVELVQALDFSSKRMLDKGIPTQKDISLYKALSKVNGMITKANAGNEAYAELAGIISDEDFESLTESALYIRDELGDNDGILNNMTTEQLERLDHVVRAIKHVVVKANEFYVANHSKGIADLSRKSIDDMGALGKAKKFEEGSVVGGTVKMLNWKNIIPTYAFKRFGEGGRIVFTALQDGWDKFAYNIKTIIDTTNKTYTDKEVEDWGQKVETFEITEPISDAEKDNPDYKPNKITLRMTVAQIMSLYCLNKREQARGHLLGGGIRVADFKDGTKVISQTDSVILTDGIIEEIIGRLTDRQKAVADMLQEFMNTVCSDWGNEVSMLRFGYNAFGEENYFPIQSDENNLAVNDATDNQNSLFRLLNMSFAKTLTDNANNTIIISDIFDVFAQHSTDMAKYNALALPVLDAFKWYNYVEKQDKGDIEGNKAHKTKSVKEAMEKAFGNDAKSYFTTFLRDINGTQNVSRDTLGNGFFKNAKIASVGANLRVVLLQPTSYLRASAVIDSKYLTRALAHKPKSADAIKHCGIALWKSLGFYDTNVQRGVEELIKHEQAKKDKAIEWAMKGAEVADRITWGYLWNACELEIRDTRKDLEIGSKEFFEAISKRLREVIYATQVVDSTMTRSEMMRSSDRLDKVLTAFASEPTLSYNMLYDAYMDLHLDARKYGKKEAWKKNGKRVARIVYAYTITNAMAALVEAGFDAFRDDDEEEKDLVYFMRLYLSNFASDMSITGKIPYIKEFHSILKGFSSSRTDTQWMESSMRAVKEWVKIFSGEGNPSKVAKNSIKAFSDFTGLPIYNVYRDVNASLDLLTGEDLGDMFNDFFE